ncbi:hypothetical protein RSOL_308820 [Rhizoctonia solani AG-3 Rhs1AP]|uniref:DUF6589 domain-containing protein n=2 Tax=Rhizoctonia solani AG-3 TaxID=1086053 RepID=A0A074S0K2_9AGAM|nr:hypothetical protein RSOL_308820 [Rhizoctonia solani AG-3 Rhs1AP]KEP50438.1 hypothetical protein V565_080140 [Rhizoctonia solani 123E]
MPARRTREEKLYRVLGEISNVEWSLGDFLRVLFTDFRARANPSQVGVAPEDMDDAELEQSIEAARTTGKTPTKAQMLGRQSTFLAQFLRHTPNDSPDSVSSIVAMIYNHHLSVPKKHRASASGPAKPDDDPKTMARHLILQWACRTVAEAAESEIKHLAGCPQLRLPTAQMNWATLLNFSFAPIQEYVKSNAPTLYAFLIRTATRPDASELDHGNSRVDPHLVSLVIILMMISTHNRQANAFQKFVGVWLFSCSAPAQIYRVLNRLSISVAYDTVLRVLVKLSESSTNLTRSIALEKDFILVIDNINRRKRIWKPDFGQQDMLMSGTAATLVEAIRCAPNAFDSSPVLAARISGHRRELTAGVLWNRINQDHLSSVMSLHCLNFLVSNCSALSHLREYANQELRTTFAIHRMPDGHITQAHPLSSSNHNEGSVGGCRDAVDNVFLGQLGLTKEQVQAKKRIIGGDMGTVNILETLITLSSQCPHGYSDYKWALPLVQLWHMGWANMARIISTYWGKGVSRDASTFWHVCSLLGQTRVKPIDRPEYYPTQALIHQTLEADVLDCWRLLLQTNDLDAYFSSRPDLCNGPALFGLAQDLVSQWATTRALEVANHSPAFWKGPKDSALLNHPVAESSDSDSDTPLAHRSQGQQRSEPEANSSSTPRDPTIGGFSGDRVLANAIGRMRDSLIHYEFIWGVADGDVGRVMEVLKVWVFTFAGSGASKYTNELLELSCGFLYEFPEALQNAIMDNWLCNFTGNPGSWMPMDLMQEHHIRDLKDKSQRRDQDFEGKFFKNILSRNTRSFAHVRSTMNQAVHLKDLSGSHGEARHTNTRRRLLASLESQKIHTFIPGRDYGWAAQDDLMNGKRRMSTKVLNFLNRPPTCGSSEEQDALANNDVPEGVDDNYTGGGNPPNPLVFPPIIVGGQLLPGYEVEDPTLDETYEQAGLDGVSEPE